jgi:hypothetical protein
VGLERDISGTRMSQVSVAALAAKPPLFALPTRRQSRVHRAPTRAEVSRGDVLKARRRSGPFARDFSKASEWKAAVVKRMTYGVPFRFKADGVERNRGTGLRPWRWWIRNRRKWLGRDRQK